MPLRHAWLVHVYSFSITRNTTLVTGYVSSASYSQTMPVSAYQIMLIKFPRLDLMPVFVNYSTSFHAFTKKKKKKLSSETSALKIFNLLNDLVL